MPVVLKVLVCGKIDIEIVQNFACQHGKQNFISKWPNAPKSENNTAQ